MNIVCVGLAYGSLLLCTTGMAMEACAGKVMLAQPAMRHVDVTVQVSSPASLPEGLVVTVSSGARVYAKQCNSTGQAVVACDFPSDATEIVVDIPTAPVPKAISTGLSRDGWTQSAAEANRLFTLPLGRHIPLVVDQTSYSATVELVPAVSIRGRAVSSGGAGTASYNVQRVGDKGSLRAQRGDQFEIRGVRKSAAGSLFFSDFNKHEVFIVPLSASQTAADSDIGAITLSPSTLDSSVHVTMTNVDQVQKDEVLERSYVTLLSVDGVRAFQLRLGEGGVARWGLPSDTADPKVAPGRYLVIPGYCARSEVVQKALRLIRAGRLADIDAASVPSITAATGQTASVTVSAVQARSALLGIQE